MVKVWLSMMLFRFSERIGTPIGLMSGAARRPHGVGFQLMSATRVFKITGFESFKASLAPPFLHGLAIIFPSYGRRRPKSDFRNPTLYP